MNEDLKILEKKSKELKARLHDLSFQAILGDNTTTQELQEVRKELKRVQFFLAQQKSLQQGEKSTGKSR